MNKLRFISLIFLLASLFLQSRIGFAQSSSPNASAIIYLSNSGYNIALAVAYSPTGKEFAVGSTNGITIFDDSTKEQKLLIKSDTWVRAIAYSSTGDKLAAAFFDNTAKLINPRTGDIEKVFLHPEWVRCVNFTPDDQYLITCADDNYVRFWNVSNGVLYRSIKFNQPLRTIAISPNGLLLAIGLQDGSIEIFDTNKFTWITTLLGHKGWVRSLAFSPDNTLLASGAFDATIIVWDLGQMSDRFTLKGHQSSILSLTFTNNGKYLISGSVDRSIKLWDVHNGENVKTLTGHEGFIYSVAVSGDDSHILSGGADNTVRIWDLNDSQLGIQGYLQNTPKDCRACHHPTMDTQPPKVIQVSCEMCHSNGVSFNFCPAFPHNNQKNSFTSISMIGTKIGIPVAGDSLAIVINYPDNGETLYTSDLYRAPLQISGQVYFSGNKSNLIVRLLIFEKEQSIPYSTLTTHPTVNGKFAFKVVYNPNGSKPISSKAGELSCAECHDDAQLQGELPGGDVKIRVEVMASNVIASDERWVKVDISKNTTVTVAVRDASNHLPVSNIPVEISTNLLNWRTRYAKSLTNESGLAKVSIERLTLSPTIYQISIPKTVYNGFWYEGTQPITIPLNTADSTLPIITMSVIKSSGQINGMITGIKEFDNLQVAAIHIPEIDHQYVNISTNGSFQFRDLMSGDYLIGLISNKKSSITYYSKPIEIELEKENQVNATVNVISGNTLQGKIVDKKDISIPFAKVSSGNYETWVEPLTGNFSLPKIDDNQLLQVRAPGYYSSELILNASSEITEVKLTPRDDTKIIHWENGYSYLPAETQYEKKEEGIDIYKGWVWGNALTNPSITVIAGKLKAKVENGRFFLEYLPPNIGWFYLADGNASMTVDDGDIMAIHPDEIIYFNQDHVTQPMLYDANILTLIRSKNKINLTFSPEPTFLEKINHQFNTISINVIQGITLITYLFAVGIILVLPILFVTKRIRKK